MKTLILLLAALLCTTATAQSPISRFPRAAITFLDAELPAMDVAVERKDRSYFSGANERMQKFLEVWGLKSNSIELEAYPMCTDAVTDFLIVGLCRISLPDTICISETFFPKFEKNLAKCRGATASNESQ